MYSLILPPSELDRPTLIRPALDLTRYAWRHQRSDITVYGTWWLAEDSGPKPCLVLTSSHNQGRRAPPCVVLLDQAWMWSEEIGDPVRAAKVAMEFVDALGLTADVKSAFRVRSIIVDHLHDLLTMPVMPNAMRVSTVLGEAKITSREGGETIRHEEFIERV